MAHKSIECALGSFSFWLIKLKIYQAILLEINFFIEVLKIPKTLIFVYRNDWMY
jgi:hypothetical protein